jgi:uncharacterized protein YfaA (DUF2138 family)
VNTISMTVTSADEGTVRLTGEIADGEQHNDGFTGADLTLWFNDSDSGVPLVVGQVVTVTLTATAEQVSVERIATDGAGQPSHVERLDPTTGEWEQGRANG